MSENLLRIDYTDGFSHIFSRKYLKQAVEIKPGMKNWTDANISGKHSHEDFIRRLPICLLHIFRPVNSNAESFAQSH